MRRGGLRLSRPQVLLLGIGVLEAADADPGDRVVDGQLEAVRHEFRTAARDAVEPPARVVEDGIAHVAGACHRGEEDHRGERGEQHRTPLPDEARGDQGTGRKRDEARLREREQEPDPHRSDRRGRSEDDPERARVQRDHQDRQHRDHQEAPVDRRVPEQRVDPVERRVDVPDEHLRVPEDVAVDPLLDPDRGEDDRHQGQLGVQGEHPAAAPVETGERNGEQAEGEVEGEELDRALANVLAPGEREAAPRDEGGERQRDRAELARPRVAAQELPGQRERRGGDHRVERHEQVRLGRPDGHRDPRGDAGERRQGQQPRPAAKQGGPGGGEDEPGDGGPGEQGRVPLRRDVDGEGRCAERPGGEPGQPQRPRGSDQQHREAGGADDPGDPCELAAHETITSVCAEWPFAVTISR